MKVVVLGASPKPDRFSNKAIQRLLRHGHEVVPVNPAYAEIEELACVARLDDLRPGSMDTVTVYMNPRRTADLAPELIRLSPRRVIFNPGAENPELADALRAAGIEVVDACTLVMLDTKSF